MAYFLIAVLTSSVWAPIAYFIATRFRPVRKVLGLALPVSQAERDKYLAPVDRFIASLACQNYMVRKRRGDTGRLINPND